MASAPSTSKYTDEEKKELIKNLEFEVSHRATQFRRGLEDYLEAFNSNQAMLLNHIPKPVRSMKMRDFGQKYDGNIQAAVMGFQKAKFISERGQDTLEKIDKDTRKRKWFASVDGDGDPPATEGPRGSKTARTVSPTKHTKPPSGAGPSQRVRPLAGTHSKNRFQSRIPASPSPQKVRPPFNAGPSTRQPSSPTKPHVGTIFNNQQRSRPPSSSTFNPLLPPKTPIYPARKHHSKEDVPNNVNGTAPNGRAEDGSRTLTRTKSNINIRRDPSFSHHSRTDSSSGNPPSMTHSRTNSASTLESPTDSLPPTEPNSQVSESPPQRSRQLQPSSSHPFFKSTYSVTIPTKDGHLLEFDPLQTSPRALDALEGITDSAKKQAREEMNRLVQAAVEKWRVR